MQVAGFILGGKGEDLLRFWKVAEGLCSRPLSSPLHGSPSSGTFFGTLDWTVLQP